MISRIAGLFTQWIRRSWAIFVLLASATAIAIDFFSNLQLRIALIFGGTLTVFAIALAAIAVAVDFRKQRESTQLALDTRDWSIFGTPTEAEFDDIADLDRASFQPDEQISASIFRTWYRVNQSTFTILRFNNRVVGYFSLLPLKNATLERFIRGEICESDFGPSDILSPHSASRASRVYLFSAVIHPDFRTRYVRQFVQRLLDERDNPSIFPSAREVYATAATREGRRLLQRFGFIKKGSGTHRMDGHDIYMCTMGRRA